MRHLSIYSSYAAICVGFFAAAQTDALPLAARHDEEAHAQRIEQRLAQSRPPVPLPREFKLTPYVPFNAVEPSVVALVVRPPATAVVTVMSGAARSEESGFRSARMTSIAKWRSVSMNGSTEMAVTQTP